MKRYMITGALGAALLALSACGNPSEVDFTENGAVVEEEATADGFYANSSDAGYDSTDIDTAAATPADPAQSTQTAEAQSFVDMASQANLTQVRTSEVALERATTPEVKAYAQMIVDDSSAARNALRTAMTGAMLTPPSMVLDADHQRRLDDITLEEQGSAPDPDTVGNAWDHDYIAMQIDLHEDTIDLFEDYASNGQNPELRTFAEASLPDLRSQLERAREIEGMVDDNNIVTPD